MHSRFVEPFTNLAYMHHTIRTVNENDGCYAPVGQLDPKLRLTLSYTRRFSTVAIVPDIGPTVNVTRRFRAAEPEHCTL